MHRTVITTCFCAITGLAATAHAQTLCGSEDAKVSPSTGQAGDLFGASLDAAAAGFGIVGAPEAGDEGSGAGRAYLYTLNTTVPQLLFELAADDGADGIDFGRSVAADNALALVGAPAESSLGPAAGAAYLYLRSTGMQIDKLTASDGRGLDLFGGSVDIDFDRAVIGASDKASSTGAVYVFEIVGLDAVERFKLTASDASAVDRFGRSVSIDGGGGGAGETGYALIGAPGNDDAGASSGSAYLFNIETGQEVAKLVAADASAGVQFGYQVELLIEGDVALAAVSAKTNNPDGSDGSVYLFDISDRANPVQLSKVTATDTLSASDFGVSVSLTPDVLLVGALSGETTLAGTAYSFDISDPANPVQTSIIRPSNPVTFAQFGATVALYESPTGLRLFAGAPADDAGDPIAGNPDVGALHALSIDVCRPDIDGDCLLTIFDFLGFQNLFDAGDLAADFDGDGSLTIFDFLAYQNAFDAGCGG
ncbi:MAG: GC-type dockerin domain-anchored protein [Phycisphaerales bacterium]